MNSARGVPALVCRMKSAIACCWTSAGHPIERSLGRFLATGRGERAERRDAAGQCGARTATSGHRRTLAAGACADRSRRESRAFPRASMTSNASRRCDRRGDLNDPLAFDPHVRARIPSALTTRPPRMRSGRPPAESALRRLPSHDPCSLTPSPPSVRQRSAGGAT